MDKMLANTMLNTNWNRTRTRTKTKTRIGKQKQIDNVKKN